MKKPRNEKIHRNKTDLVLEGLNSIGNNTKKVVNLIETKFPNIKS